MHFSFLFCFISFWWDPICHDIKVWPYWLEVFLFVLYVICIQCISVQYLECNVHNEYMLMVTTLARHSSCCQPDHWSCHTWLRCLIGKMRLFLSPDVRTISRWEERFKFKFADIMSATCAILSYLPGFHNLIRKALLELWMHLLCIPMTILPHFILTLSLFTALWYGS